MTIFFGTYLDGSMRVFFLYYSFSFLLGETFSLYSRDPSLRRARLFSFTIEERKQSKAKMPFTSARQLQTCYGRRLSAKAKGQKWAWDCDGWTRETMALHPGVSLDCALPTTAGGRRKQRCRRLRKGEPIKSKLHRGKRGGLYFFVGGVKVYVPPDARAWVRKHFTVVND